MIEHYRLKTYDVDLKTDDDLAIKFKMSAYISKDDSIHYVNCECDDLDFVFNNAGYIRETLDKKVREENDCK